MKTFLRLLCLLCITITLAQAQSSLSDFRAPTGKYPVFKIDLPPGSTWTDFELKGSTDTFATLAFYYHSPDPQKATITSQVWTVLPKVFFTDSGGSVSGRRWIPQSSTQSIFAMLTDAQSEVGGFILVVQDAGLSKDRDKIAFVYSLISASTPDKDASDRTVWRPIVPSAWVDSFQPNP